MSYWKAEIRLTLGEDMIFASLKKFYNYVMLPSISNISGAEFY